MSAGCGHGTESFDGASDAFRRALWVVITINGVMFIVELAAGALAGSKALQADALDFLGDTLTYALSLWAIGKSVQVRTSAALIKGGSLAIMGLWVLGSTLFSILSAGEPRAEIMGVVGFLALAANLASVGILLRFRDGDSNVRSVWLCSRNDAIGNVAVMVAAVLVWATASRWPDLVVAAAMAGLFLWSSGQIIRQALHERRAI